MKDTPQVTADMVRTLYPNPVSCWSDDRDEQQYCVLGALHLIHDSELGVPFPRAVHPESSEVLRHYNPSLTPGSAQCWADRIIRANDARQFECAWRLLDEALSWKPGS